VRARPIPGQPSRFKGSPGRVQLKDLRGRFTSAVGISWQGLEVLIENARSRGDSVVEAVEEVARQLPEEMVRYAQTMAPWEDRTGEARRRLQARVFIDSERGIVVLYLGHGVPYGVHLETMQGGRFQIIMPTILHFEQLVIERVASANAMGRNIK